MKAIFLNRAVYLYKKISSEYFFPACDRQSGWCGYGHIKMRTKKNLVFQEEKTCINGQKRTKNGYCVNPPFAITCKNSLLLLKKCIFDS